MYDLQKYILDILTKIKACLIHWIINFLPDNSIKATFLEVNFNFEKYYY